MYRIMLADDESIVIESLKFIIEQKYGKECEIQYAKTGRSVIELAENFRPDIAFMDIQMPGINGIEAMKEIKKTNNSTIFIVMTAFDKFDYAKEAIDLGVLEYLSKPATREKIENVLQKAMDIIDKNRETRSKDLIIKEKLETVVPFIERGLVYTVFLDEKDMDSSVRYRQLLGIEEEYAYVVVLEAGEKVNDLMTNVVGAGVRLEDHYLTIKDELKNHFNVVVGPVMTNKVLMIIPCESESAEFNNRVHVIDDFRQIIHKFEDELNTEFKLGIGSIKSFDELNLSYREAISALNLGVSTVSHANDLELGCKYEADYPVDTEKKIFEAVEAGDTNELKKQISSFWDFMITNYPSNLNDIKLKALEFVLVAESIGYRKGNMFYRFLSRTEYMPFVYNCNDMHMLNEWFVTKMIDACQNVANAKEELMKSPIERTVAYIRENYSEELSLESVSQIVNVSPYYLSRLFKTDMGVNFLDYLTGIRIAKAKELLDRNELTVKEVGISVGYLDSNYFSRIFKKNTGVTPTEYRDMKDNR